MTGCWRGGGFGNDVKVLPRKIMWRSRGSHFALLRPVRQQMAIALAFASHHPAPAAAGPHAVLVM